MLDKTYTYRYDNRGNIMEKRTYAYTTGTTIGASTGITCNYSDTNWQDKLTSYDGKDITYDANGNPLTFDGYTYTWKAGRQLAGISKNGLTVGYTYDGNGIRTSKTVNGIKTTYNLVDSKIISETTGNSITYYRYDSNNKLVGLFYDGQDYFYVRNLQNDIIGIVNSSGNICVNYTYDAWGNVTVSGAMESTLGVDNPFRYRGYYYDKETGLYYLQSRYYNPSIGRFINADIYLGDQSLNSHNLFTYCKNNPVTNYDPNGYSGRNVFIVYDNPGSGFLEQARWMANYAYKNKNVSYYYVRTASDFVRVWNNIFSSINNLHLFVHGGAGCLYFKNSTLYISDIQRLYKKSIGGKCYLYSCHGGTSNRGTSIAAQISKRIYGARVRAVVNGKVYYRAWYQLFSKKPLTKEWGAYWADFYWIKNGTSLRKINIGRDWRL